MGVCNGTAHSCAVVDGIIAMGDTGSLDKVPGIGSHTRVVPGVFSKRPFFIKRFRVHKTLHYHFGHGGNRQIDRFALDHIHRPFTKGTGYFVFRNKG